MISSDDEQPLDARSRVVTPENIEVQYRVAGPVRRGLALLLDLAILNAALVIVTLFTGFLGILNSGFAMGVTLVCYFVMYWFFFGFQEAYFGGRTLGKRAQSLRVISIDGQPINGLQAIMRSFLRLPTFTLPIIDLVTMSLNDRFQRLGDIVCGTVVVIDDRAWLFGVTTLSDPRTTQLAAFIPADFEITKSLAKALSNYVERRNFFSVARRKEVAAHIAVPLLKKFNLPLDTSYDLLLCALYYRAFIADRGEEKISDTLAASLKASPTLAAPSLFPASVASTTAPAPVTPS